MGYVYLFLAIAFEVTGTLMLPISKNFTKPIPSIIIIALYILSTYLMTFTLDYFPLGIVYAIWSALGIAVVAIMKSVPLLHYYNHILHALLYSNIHCI